MLLAIDMGNTQTAMGLFDGDELVQSWRMPTDRSYTADEIHVRLMGFFKMYGLSLDAVDAIAFAGVVPQLSREWHAVADRIAADAIVIGPQTAAVTKLRAARPQAVGADRVANAVAAETFYGAPAIVVDFGTATNIDVIDEGGYYSDRNGMKKKVTDGVQYATELGMYAIIDWHLLNVNPKNYTSEARSFFKEMAQKYKNYDNVIYEICNEPNNGTSWKEIKSYAKSVISTIRENDKKAVIVVGTPTWSQDVDQAAADPIKGENLMYALHFYAATHKADLRNKMTAAINKGLPVFVTEYGICDASGNGAIDKKEADRWIQTMDEYGVSYIAWNLSNKQESSSIIKSSCSKVSGFKKSELSDEGRWLYHLLRKKAGLTK